MTGKIDVRDGEAIQAAVRRFKRRVREASRITFEKQLMRQHIKRGARRRQQKSSALYRKRIFQWGQDPNYRQPTST